jgi:hypothetical protein
VRSRSRPGLVFSGIHRHATGRLIGAARSIHLNFRRDGQFASMTNDYTILIDYVIITERGRPNCH